MNIQLDADTCVYLLNNKPESVRKRFDSLPLGTAAVSAVVVAELRYGVSKSKSKEKTRLLWKRFCLPCGLSRLTMRRQKRTAEYGRNWNGKERP